MNSGDKMKWFAAAEHSTNKNSDISDRSLTINTMKINLDMGVIVFCVIGNKFIISR